MTLTLRCVTVNKCPEGIDKYAYANHYANVNFIHRLNDRVHPPICVSVK